MGFEKIFVSAVLLGVRYIAAATQFSIISFFELVSVHY